VSAAPSVPLLEVEALRKTFQVRRGIFGRDRGDVHAVDGISFRIEAAETLGLVGESGCGKSTAARTILKLLEPSSGHIRLRGQDITALTPPQMRLHRRDMQMIFQDPYSSLNPRMSAGAIIAEPLVNYGMRRAQTKERVGELLGRVGLRPEQMRRYPHEFSGGQRQRLGIARALALNPSLIIADEPVSALDVSVQAQVINLLMDLQDEYGLSYLFIAHDLAVIKHISHRVGVMYLGKLVELAGKTALFQDPLHPYTEALLSAVPHPEPPKADARRQRIVLKGDVPSPVRPPPGCRFHTRCPYVFDRCLIEEPTLQEVLPGHSVACHLRDATDDRKSIVL
jgi:oligopeptide/dipeptide ABC transporter ATP-binding protein